MEQFILAIFICLTVLSTTASCGNSENSRTGWGDNEFDSIEVKELEDESFDELNHKTPRIGWGDNEFSSNRTNSLSYESPSELEINYGDIIKLDYYPEKYPFDDKYLFMYFKDMNIDGTLANVELSGSIENVEIKGNLENVYKALVDDEEHLKSVINRLASEGHICKVLGHDFIDEFHLYSFPPGHKTKTFQFCNICGITRIIKHE